MMNDNQLRQAVKVRILARDACDPRTRILDELGLQHGIARIDLAVVNGILHGYELKSDRDSLKRLPRQIQIYNSVLDKVTLIVGRRHETEAKTLIPDWWGFRLAKKGRRGGFEFTTIQRGSHNPSIDALSVAKLLWREEALTLLDELGEAEYVRYKARASVYARLVEVADLVCIRERVRRQLKSRTTWRVDQQQKLHDD